MCLWGVATSLSMSEPKYWKTVFWNTAMRFGVWETLGWRIARRSLKKAKQIRNEMKCLKCWRIHLSLFIFVFADLKSQIASKIGKEAILGLILMLDADWKEAHLDQTKNAEKVCFETWNDWGKFQQACLIMVWSWVDKQLLIIILNEPEVESKRELCACAS